MTRLRIVAGSVGGAIVALLVSPLFRPLFHPPTVGAGFVTVHGYPKGFDYFSSALVILLALGGGVMAGGRLEPRDVAPQRRRVLPWTMLVFVLMLFAHDYPYAFLDHFHDGEHLAPGFLMKSGVRPYSGVFLLHGLATDGGLDALTMGEPPSPGRVRRVTLVLDAAALALLVPLASELCATGAGIAVAVVLSWSAIAAGLLPLFPWFRLFPPLLGCLFLLRYLRLGRTGWLFGAFICATLGVLWSLDTGTYAVAAVVVSYALIRIFSLEREAPGWGRVIALAGIAMLLPLLVLLVAGADLRQFFLDSFVVIPRSIDAIWALPAPVSVNSEALRFWFAPVVYGLLLALAWQSRSDKPLSGRILVVTMFSLFLLRTSAGRVSWSHTRFALPFVGMALIAFLIEPLWRERRHVAVVALIVPLVLLLEVGPNLLATGRSVAGWRGRQSHEGLVAYPLSSGKGIYTYQQDHDELAALNGLISSRGGPEATFYDFAGERALYYLLQRKAPVRCLDPTWMSVPELRKEAMSQLTKSPPVCIILKGPSGLEAFDGVSNRDRAPVMAAWIDANYPHQLEIGRYVVAVK
jgi:hypothetical protein